MLSGAQVPNAVGGAEQSAVGSKGSRASGTSQREAGVSTGGCPALRLSWEASLEVGESVRQAEGRQGFPGGTAGAALDA